MSDHFTARLYYFEDLRCSMTVDVENYQHAQRQHLSQSYRSLSKAVSSLNGDLVRVRVHL